MVTLKTTLVSQEKTPGTESVNKYVIFVFHVPSTLYIGLFFVFLLVVNWCIIWNL